MKTEIRRQQEIIGNERQKTDLRTVRATSDRKNRQRREKLRTEVKERMWKRKDESKLEEMVVNEGKGEMRKGGERSELTRVGGKRECGRAGEEAAKKERQSKLVKVSRLDERERKRKPENVEGSR